MRYLILLILGILVIRYLFRKKKTRQSVTIPAAEVLKQDPVCGVYVRAQRDLCLKSEAGDVYFCSEACMKKYRKVTPD